MAGYIGCIDRRVIGSLKYREIHDAWRGKDSQTWWHTASIVASIINCHIDLKRHRPIEARHLHPYEGTRLRIGMAITKETMGAFTAMFVSPEKAAAADRRAQQEKAEADRLAARMRQRLAVSCN